MEEDPFSDPSSRSTLLTCSFNQDGGCLSIGTTTGFSVHNIHPHYGVSVHRELQGGVGQVELLFRCNLMALVGGGPSPHAPPHRVIIWDDNIPKEAGELSFRQTVLRVRLRKDAIAVALHDRVYVYHFSDLSLRDKIYTADNPQGLLCLSTQVQDMVLACPSVTPGHVRVELYGLRKTVVSCIVHFLLFVSNHQAFGGAHWQPSRTGSYCRRNEACHGVGKGHCDPCLGCCILFMPTGVSAWSGKNGYHLFGVELGQSLAELHQRSRNSSCFPTGGKRKDGWYSDLVISVNSAKVG